MLRNLWETVLSGTILAGFFATVIPLYIDYLLKRRQAEQQELLKGRLAEQQELLKGYLAADLERAKHSLVLEQSRLTFVYEKQRDSFTNVIRAMHAAITAFKFDYSDEEWLPIDEDTLADFRSVRVSESLYTGSDGDRAITVFEDRLAGCTLNNRS
jgi:hypothetical protein